MAQTKVKLISDGVIVQGNLHASHGITTAHIGEGSNLYYTDARVGSYLSTNSFATESYVGTQITNLVDSSPSALNTLNELAAALGDDENFSTTVTNSIATKLPLTGGTLTGDITISSTSPELKIVDTNSFTDVNDRWIVRAGADTLIMRWFDWSLGTNTDVLTLSPTAATFVRDVTIAGDITAKVGNFRAPSATASIINQFADSNGNNCATFRTTTPGQIFEIRSQNSGTIKIDSTSTTFTGSVTGTIARFDTLNNNANSANIIYRSGTDTIVGGGSPPNKIYIQDNGDVGIGTDSPSYKLEVNGGTALVGGGFYVSTDQSISTNFAYTFRDAVGINNPNSISATANTGYTMCVGRSHDSGSGVSGSISAVGTIRASAFTTGINTTAGVGASNGDVNAAEIGPGYLNLSRDDTAASQQIRFEKNGALHSYIETTTSGLNIGNANVYLAKSTNQGQLFFGTADNQYEIFGGGTWGYMGYNTSGYHRFFGSGTERMRITNAGNVGIGITSPKTRLVVRGTLGIGPAIADNNIAYSSTNFSHQDGGALHMNYSLGGNSSSGDTITFTYAATTWKSWSLKYNFASTSGITYGVVGGYWNNSGGSSNHTEHNNHGVSVAVTHTGQGNTVTFTFTNLGTHPMAQFVYMQGGGDGQPRADRVTLNGAS